MATMATATTTYDVFLSHGSRDKKVAADVASRLQAEGFEPLYDAYPLNRVDDILGRIRHNLQPLSDNERMTLAETYRDLGVPADQLGQSPSSLRSAQGPISIGSSSLFPRAICTSSPDVVGSVKRSGNRSGIASRWSGEMRPNGPFHETLT